MPQAIDIIVKNNLIMEKRGLNVYHHSDKSAHIISPDGSIRVPLTADKGGDYLHISAVRGPGPLLRGCVLDIPSWAEFEFSLEGKVTISHKNERTILRIPPGPPAWQLKIAGQAGTSSRQQPDYISVGDGEPGGKK